MHVLSSKLIIVMGLPRSGTSIMTYSLAEHPDIQLFISGPQCHVLENDLLPKWQGTNKDIEQINAIIEEAKGRYVLLKRPWEEARPQKYKEYFPNAFYIIMFRDFSTIKKSWETSGMVGKQIRENSLAIYAEHLLAVSNFPKKVETNRYKIISKEDMVENTDIIFSDLAEALNIPNKFDISLIHKGGKWDHELYKKY